MSNLTNRAYILASLGALVLTTAANASVVYGDWNYAIDSNNDGSGGASYEIQGLAYRHIGNDIVFAISTGMPSDGVSYGDALNGRISSGDMFLNFSSHNLGATADFNDPMVYGVRFDATNDSLGNVGGSNGELGLYGRITAESLTTQNHGWGNLQAYLDNGFGRNVGAMGDLNSSTADVIPYLGNGAQYPNMKEATRLGSISLKSRSDLEAIGLDFGHFSADPSGNNVYGFSMSRDLLPSSDFTAHLLHECINDGVAIQGTNAVPEPATMAALGIGIAALARKRRRNSS